MLALGHAGTKTEARFKLISDAKARRHLGDTQPVGSSVTCAGTETQSTGAVGAQGPELGPGKGFLGSDSRDEELLYERSMVRK